MMLIAAIFGLALLMVVHEAGHFLVARAYGMRVTRFSIGFGPTFFKIQPKDGYFWFTSFGEKVRLRLWKHDPAKNGPTVYQVGMIPFLAYVQIAGMNPLEEIDENDKGSYANGSLTGRILTIFGGPLTNYLFASVLFFMSFIIGGKAVLTPEGKPIISTRILVIDDKPAVMAGMRDYDNIVEIDGHPVTEFQEVADIIERHAGETVKVVVDRGGQRVALNVTPNDEKGKGKIGVEGLPNKMPVSIGEAATSALAMPPAVVRSVVVGLVMWATHKAEGELTGPIGIAREAERAARHGATEYLEFLGLLSAYLGAFNLIPFPALDGGRLLFLGYEATTRRRPNARIEAHIHAFGLLFMLGLMAWVTVWKDLHLGSK